MAASSRRDDETTPGAPKHPEAVDRSARRAFVIVAVVVVALAAALSGAWYYAANRLDLAVRAAIAAAGGQGVSIDCRNQSVFGYPFRLGLHCDRLAVSAPDKGFGATGGALRTAAQIYEPSRVVAELDAPLRLQAEGAPPVEINWTLAQASAHFWTEGLDRFALVLQAPTVAFSGAEGAAASPGAAFARSDHLEIHAQRREDSLDLAFADQRIVLSRLASAELPPFDIAGDLTVDDTGDWLSGRRVGRTLGEALAGKAGTIRTMRIALSGPANAPAGSMAMLPSAELSGPFKVADDGKISGEFALAVAEPQAIADLAAGIDPRLAGIASTVASGIGFAGRSENGRTVLNITVAGGKASLGFIPLGRLPALK